MYFSFKGPITFIGEDYVVVEVGDIGYQVFVSHVSDYKLGEISKIYLYNVVREDEQYLAGFSSIREKEAFVSLISVKGIGPRTALNALSATNADDLFNAVAANNVTFLKKLPGIGAKAAAQIILDLKGQLTGGTKGDPGVYEEVYDALKAMGFKGAAIDRVLATINEPDASAEQVLKIALNKLRK